MEASRYRKVLHRSAVETIKWIAGIGYRREMERLRLVSESEYWSYQQSKLKKVYADAVLHVPYYKERPDVYPTNLDVSSNVHNVLSQLPVLPKEVVKNQIEKFWRVPPLFGTAQHSTGGSSTGTPLPIRASLSERGQTNALLENRFVHTVGKRRPRVVRISGFVDKTTSRGGLFWRIPATNVAYMSVYGISEKNRQSILAFLQDFKPEVIHGYASAIHQLALLMKEEDLSAVSPGLAVITTAETLTPEHREDIESILEVPVYDEYGSQEGQHFVMQCAAGSMHIHPARGVVEILSFEDDVPVSPGEMGRVVVTGLFNRTMPLFRYDIGDTAISTGFNTDCSCGLCWPTIGPIQGRVEQLFRTRDGRKISMLANATMKGVNSVVKWQVVQTDYERFLYRIVDNGDMAERRRVEEHVKRELENRLDVDVEVQFDYVVDIPRTISGKHLPVLVEFRD